MKWKAPGTSNVMRRYDYEYDQLGRMTNAVYSETGTGSSVTNRYGERVSYDANGNITGLTRRGKRNNSTYGNIDVLSVTRDGNRLKKVTDSYTTRLNYYGASDFVDGANLATEYEYYGNGALKKDLNRGISSVTYDNTGHLSGIFFSDGSSTTYEYSAEGHKLKTTHMSGGTAPVQTTTEYRGGLVIENESASRYAFPGGYVTFSGDSVIWHYYVQDYQGNNRMVVNGSGNVEQVTHYYPYGGVIGNISTNEDTQKYKFLGKELDRKFGLDWYDDEARMYDAIGVPRFTAIDPLAEKYNHLSPYSYCGGDPVNYIDVSGREPTLTEAAKMNSFLYNDLQNIKDIGGNWDLVYQLQQQNGGYMAALFSRDGENGKEYAYVFRGTVRDSNNDWYNNFAQIVGLSSQYQKAMKDAIILNERFKDNELTFVGHSKAGGQAAAAATATGRKAITINAAGMSKSTKVQANLLRIKGKVSGNVTWLARPQIKAHILISDPLNAFQKIINMQADGKRIYHINLNKDAIINGHANKNFTNE